MWMIETLARAEGVTVCEEEGATSPTHVITERKFSLTQLFDIFFGLKGKLSPLATKKVGPF